VKEKYGGPWPSRSVSRPAPLGMLHTHTTIDLLSYTSLLKREREKELKKLDKKVCMPFLVELIYIINVGPELIFAHVCVK